jgi:RNA polymerase sigma-54 factor
MLRQSLQQSLQQKLSPQQIQLMKLLQLPMVSLEARIKEELEENPALDDGSEEEDWEAEEKDDLQQDDEESFEDFSFDDYLEDEDDSPDYSTYVNNSAEQEEREIPFAQSRSFQDLLKSQLDLCILSDHEEKIALNIIGNLDDAGYLQRELFAMVDDLAFTQNIETSEEEILTVLHVIQSLDPPGIGARNLQECLILQLDRKSP